MNEVRFISDDIEVSDAVKRIVKDASEDLDATDHDMRVSVEASIFPDSPGVYLEVLAGIKNHEMTSSICMIRIGRDQLRAMIAVMDAMETK